MEQMGLTEVLGMQRSNGLGAVIRRIRRDVGRALDEKKAS
jgi:sulfur transfer protein SufE